MPPDDLENFLQRYRPVAPPPALRQKVLAPPAAQHHWPTYCFRAAVAAMLLVSLGLLHAADALNRSNRERIGTGPTISPSETQQRFIAQYLRDLP